MGGGWGTGFFKGGAPGEKCLVRFENLSKNFVSREGRVKHLPKMFLKFLHQYPSLWVSRPFEKIQVVPLMLVLRLEPGDWYGSFSKSGELSSLSQGCGEGDGGEGPPRRTAANKRTFFRKSRPSGEDVGRNQRESLGLGKKLSIIGGGKAIARKKVFGVYKCSIHGRSTGEGIRKPTGVDIPKEGGGLPRKKGSWGDFLEIMFSLGWLRELRRVCIRCVKGGGSSILNNKTLLLRRGDITRSHRRQIPRSFYISWILNKEPQKTKKDSKTRGQIGLKHSRLGPGSVKPGGWS